MFNIYLQNTNVEFDTNEIASLRIKKHYSTVSDGKIKVKVINFSTKREYIFPHSTVLCSLCVQFVEQCLKHECETEEAARKKKVQ